MYENIPLGVGKSDLHLSTGGCYKYGSWVYILMIGF